MKTEKKLPIGITEEMVATAKNKFGNDNVKLAELPKDDDGNEVLSVLVRVPNRQVINEFTKWYDKNPGKAEDILVNACLLSHKDEVKADELLIMGAVNAIVTLIPVRKGTIKNL